MGTSVWDLLHGVSRYTYPQWAEMLSPGLWSGYASVGFERCTSLDLQREEFYPSINMLCPGWSCSLDLLGAWEKLPSHSISNVSAWGFLTPGLLVHVGHTVHKLPSDFCRGSRSKSTVYVSRAPTQGFCPLVQLQCAGRNSARREDSCRMHEHCCSWPSWDHRLIVQSSLH